MMSCYLNLLFFTHTEVLGVIFLLRLTVYNDLHNVSTTGWRTLESNTYLSGSRYAHSFPPKTHMSTSGSKLPYLIHNILTLIFKFTGLPFTLRCSYNTCGFCFTEVSTSWCIHTLCYLCPQTCGMTPAASLPVSHSAVTYSFILGPEIFTSSSLIKIHH